MITTGDLKRKAWGEARKLKIVKTGSNPFEARPKPRPEGDIVPGTKIGGRMLVTGGMEDRVQNAKRKRLMELVKEQKIKAAATIRVPYIKTITHPIADIPKEIPKMTTDSKSELYSAFPEPPAAPPEKMVIHQVKAEIKPDGSMIALEDSRPEKKKRGRPKKKDKETE